MILFDVLTKNSLKNSTISPKIFFNLLLTRFLMGLGRVKIYKNIKNSCKKSKYVILYHEGGAGILNNKNCIDHNGFTSIKNIDRKTLFSVLMPVFSVIYLEVLLHLLAIGTIDWRIIVPVLFSVPCGLVIYFISTCFGKKANNVIYFLAILVISIYFVVQYVYHSIFGDFMPLFQVKMGGAAVTNFFDQMLYGIGKIIFFILLFFIPLVASVVLLKKKLIVFERPNLRNKLLVLPVILLAHFVCLISLTFGGTGPFSTYDIYYGSNSQTNATIANLGVVTTARLEFTNMLFHPKSSIVIVGINDEPDRNKTDNTDKNNSRPGTSNNESPEKEPNGSESDVPVISDPVEPYPTPETHNMLNIDFEDMINYESDPDIITLHKYFMSKQPTKKNEYTGYFKDYNLIMLCAESYSPYFISEELTPTLYKMVNGGFVFNNYYGAFESNTTNGEYTFCMGMFPDLSRTKTDNSFIASAANYLPYTIANVFDKQLGVTSYAFHNYYGTYYQRFITHPNMGYDFMSPETGLDIDVYWPSSDFEMMEASIDEYLTTDKPFHAYYMTFSGHYQYNWMNPMSTRNRDKVMGLGYTSEAVQAYIACNLELEKALTYIVDRLTEAGVADKTVIVLTNDHYPYGLSEDEYNELAGMEIDTQFGKYKNSFICWTPSMIEPVIVDQPCGTIDILPTLLNLFGFEYDSRLLCGIDALSDSEHIAILADQSFITEEMTFSSSMNVVNPIVPDTELDSEDIQNWKNYVKNTFTVSTAILNKNYYAKFDYLFGDDVDPYSTYPPKNQIADSEELPADDTASDTGEAAVSVDPADTTNP